MSYNVDLMLEVRGLIQQFPELHDQRIWSDDTSTSCGTRMCIAGWTAAALGMSVDQANEDYQRRHPATNDPFPIDAFAAEKLGLTYEEAHDLFYFNDNETALAQLDKFIEKGKNQ